MISGSQILRPVSRSQWREPSQRSGLHQIENRTWFSCEARTSDGLLYWRGWFEDRDQAGEFFYRLIRHQICNDPLPAEIRRWPQGPSYPHTFITSSWYPARYEGEWRQEWRDLPLSYELATVVFLTSTSSSNQTYNKPVDWIDAGSKIEGVAGGGSGGVGSDSTGGTFDYAAGGGGAAYAKITNFSFTGSSATYRLEAAAAGASIGTGASISGIDGKDCWFNDTAFPTTGSNKIGAKAGSGGNFNPPFTGPGGTAAASYASGGTTAKQSGGDGAIADTFFSAGGGGGAGGPNGDGVAGTAATTDNQGTAGGAGDNGSGGSGSAGSVVGDTANGGAGLELGDLTKGCGGASGGCFRTNVNATTGGAGLYGAASGGAAITSATAKTATSGSAAQGLIVITYTSIVPNLIDSLWGPPRTPKYSATSYH